MWEYLARKTRPDTPLPGGAMIVNEFGYRLIYYKTGQYAGHVIGWSRRYTPRGQPLDQWDQTDFGSPERASKLYPGLRDEILRIVQK